MNNLDHIKNKVSKLQREINQLVNMLDRVADDGKREDFTQLPGIVGMFDGTHLVAEDGTKHEVPANYAAKSRIVFGDQLKLIVQDGKNLFKQLEKVDRKKVAGILNKKEGKWYILTDGGSYKISDIAAGFNGAEVNDEAVALIPANNQKAPFAALDELLKLSPTTTTTTAAVPPAPAVAPKPAAKPQPKDQLTSLRVIADDDLR